MDVAGLSIMLKQSQVQQQASLSVMKKAMNMGEQNAAQLLEMMGSSQEAPHPHLGKSIDLQV